jgi:aquaporin related protein
MNASKNSTDTFTVFAFGGTQVANTAALYSDRSTAGQESDGLTQAPNTSILLYISLIFGFSLMVTVWVFFRVSGGLFNPAVSLPHTPLTTFTHVVSAHYLFDSTPHPQTTLSSR